MEINIYCRSFKSNEHWGEGMNTIQKHTDRVDYGPTRGYYGLSNRCLIHTK